MTGTVVRAGNAHKRVNLFKNICTYPILYLMVLPALAYYILFHYMPMFGLVIAFQDYKVVHGFLGSEWVGLKHFHSFLGDAYFLRTLRNTLLISIYQLLWGFPVPILFALFLNEVRSKSFVRVTQTIVYIPHFISAVVMCSLIRTLCGANGPISGVMQLFGMPKTDLLGTARYFRTVYVTAEIWQEFGWGSIIYFAALTGIDPALYEAATLDGANRFQKAWHISLPGILPTIVILLILKIGNIMSIGWEKIILLYNPMTYETADVISTYSYRRGLQNLEYSYASAISFFNGVINLVLILGANAISRKLNDTSLW